MKQVKRIQDALILLIGVFYFTTSYTQEIRPDGIVVPRLNTAQREGISNPQNGQIIYNTDLNCFDIYQNNQWSSLCALGNTKEPAKWAQKAAFGGAARQNAVSFSIQSTGYIGTGTNVSSYFNDFWAYDSCTDSWTQKASLPGAGRILAIGFAVNNKGYVGFGVTGLGNYLNDFYEYDPTVDQWTDRSSSSSIIPIRFGAVAFSIGNKGYMGTGFNATGYLTDFWEYDPTLASWTSKKTFAGVGRSLAVGFPIGSLGYVGTGFNGNPQKDFWQYDPATDNWLQRADLPGQARVKAVGFGLEGLGYIITGSSSTVHFDALNDVWEYNPQINRWIQRPTFNGISRFRAVAFTIGNKAYLGCGNDFNSQNLNDFWEYAPSSLYNGPNQLLTLNSENGLDLKGFFREGGLGNQTWVVETSANPNANIELRQTKSGGTPYIQFSNDGSVAFDARIILTNPDLLTFEGAGLNVLGMIQSTGGVLTSSDRRLKTNLAPIENPMTKIAQLKGYYYDWKVEEYKSRNFSENRQIGFIAQEMEQQFPELVHTDPEGYKSVDYARFTPVLVSAIQQQQASLVEIGQRLQTLISDNHELKKQLKTLSLFDQDMSLIEDLYEQIKIEMDQVESSLSSK